ncbi:MAG: DUF2110 family protein [Promethearchaeota archaeon]
MTKKIVLFDRIYNIPSEKRKKDIYVRYLKYLNEHIKGFSKNSLNINKLRNFDHRFEISIHGPDENFIYNLLQKEIGTIIEFKDIKEGKIYKGSMVDVGKVGFGIFIDCAILNPKVDVLINLHSLRSQLCNGKEKSLREIIEAYDFIDKFPVYVKITKVDKVNNKLQGEIAKKTLILFNKLLKENIEGVFLSGETKGQFKKVMVKNGHLQDIISIKRFGFLENLVILKKDSNAPGIIAHIGRDLTNCKLSALRPKRIKTLFE